MRGTKMEAALVQNAQLLPDERGWCFFLRRLFGQRRRIAFRRGANRVSAGACAGSTGAANGELFGSRGSG
jgi:hypothetical protein